MSALGFTNITLSFFNRENVVKCWGVNFKNSVKQNLLGVVSILVRSKCFPDFELMLKAN